PLIVNPVTVVVVSPPYSFVMTTFFFSSRRRHTRSKRDWSSDVCSSDLSLFKTASDFIVRDELVTRETVRHAAEVACALYVVMSAQRVSTGTRLHIVSCCKQQV